MTVWEFIVDVCVAITSIVAIAGLARKYQPYLAS
jgi:hypothetical protein